jgi:hypothetical protein
MIAAVQKTGLPVQQIGDKKFKKTPFWPFLVIAPDPVCPTYKV